MSSIIPVAIVAGVWYHLARQGITTTTMWLGCNLLDTFRALRLIRPNGRAVGQRTRRKAMRDSLICWTSFIVIQQLGGIPDKLLGWLPVYSLVRSLVVAGFSVARVSASETIYTTIIQPSLRKYETPIDLSIELISSIILLVYHFTLEYPIIRLHSVIRPRIERLASLFSAVKGPISTLPSKDIVVDLTQSDDDDEVKSAKETTAKETVGVIRQSTPRASRVQQLIQSCEQKSPALSTRDESPRSHLTRPPVPLEPTQSSSNNITTRTRFKPVTKLSSAAASSSASREPARPVTSRPRAPVKASKDTQRQPTSRPPAPSVKSAGSILTESRPAPTASEANIVRADPPLVKSKSSNHLKSTKPYVTDITAQRPVKSAPTRRLPTKPFAGDDPNSPRAKKLAHAAERAREIRERRRREPGVTPGEKRPPPAMSSVDAPGSKRTRISVVRD